MGVERLLKHILHTGILKIRTEMGFIGAEGFFKRILKNVKLK